MVVTCRMVNEDGDQAAACTLWHMMIRQGRAHPSLEGMLRIAGGRRTHARGTGPSCCRHTQPPSIHDTGHPIGKLGGRPSSHQQQPRGCLVGRSTSLSLARCARSDKAQAAWPLCCMRGLVHVHALGCRWGPPAGGRCICDHPAVAALPHPAHKMMTAAAVQLATGGGGGSTVGKAAWLPAASRQLWAGGRGWPRQPPLAQRRCAAAKKACAAAAAASTMAKSVPAWAAARCCRCRPHAVQSLV